MLDKGPPAGSFSQPGLGGREGEVKELGVWGGNPSVTWNAYLERWLMVNSTFYPQVQDAEAQAHGESVDAYLEGWLTMKSTSDVHAGRQCACKWEG